MRNQGSEGTGSAWANATVSDSTLAVGTHTHTHTSDLATARTQLTGRRGPCHSEGWVGSLGRSDVLALSLVQRRPSKVPCLMQPTSRYSCCDPKKPVSSKAELLTFYAFVTQSQSELVFSGVFSLQKMPGPPAHHSFFRQGAQPDGARASRPSTAAAVPGQPREHVAAAPRVVLSDSHVSADIMILLPESQKVGESFLSIPVCVCVYLCLCPLYACVYLLTGQSEATAHALLHLAYCWGHREVSVLENEPHRTSDSEPLPPAPARPHGWNIGAHNSDPQPDSPTCLTLAALGPGKGSRGHREEP